MRTEGVDRSAFRHRGRQCVSVETGKFLGVCARWIRSALIRSERDRQTCFPRARAGDRPDGRRGWTHSYLMRFARLPLMILEAESYAT